MMSHRAICGVLTLLIAASTSAFVAAAENMAAAKKAPAKAKRAPPGRTETLACRLGTEDRHARIAVVVIRGKTDSFAYYSKWKPRTCSVYLQRKGDMFSRWADNGNITTVSLEKGAFLIEHKPGEYHFIFRDIDRERYCGMDGVINGSLTIKRGSDQCVLDGEIMVEGTPLGEAHVAREPQGPLSSEGGASDITPAAAPATAPAAAPAAAAQPPAKKEPAPAPQSTAPPANAPAAPAKTEAPPPEKPVESGASAAPAPAAVAAQKPAGPEPQSGSPFSTFFRSLNTGRSPTDSATTP